jgi:hypothetical protein
LFNPSGDTSFAKAEPLFAYFELDEPELAENSASPVPVHLKNSRFEHRQAQRGFRANQRRRLQAGSQFRAPYRAKVPFDRLPTGNYSLEVQAATSMGRSIAWLSANFEDQMNQRETLR